MNYTEKDIARFWSKVDIKSEDECWNWLSYKDKDNYGGFTIRFNEKYYTYKCHRISYTLNKGNILEGMCVCHACDNPSCVNPKHLFMGTIQENVTDMVNKNRQAKLKGEKQNGAKLTEKQVLEIRNSNFTYKELANKYGVSRGYIGHIKNRRNWSHI